MTLSSFFVVSESSQKSSRTVDKPRIKPFRFERIIPLEFVLSNQPIQLWVEIWQVEIQRNHKSTIWPQLQLRRDLLTRGMGKNTYTNQIQIRGWDKYKYNYNYEEIFLRGGWECNFGGVLSSITSKWKRNADKDLITNHSPTRNTSRHLKHSRVCDCEYI